jgi:hypothetical protein
MGSRAKFRDPHIERLSRAIDEIITGGFGESREVETLYRAISHVKDDPDLQKRLEDRLKKYSLALLKLQSDTVGDMNSIFADSESFKEEERKGLRWVRA